MNDNSDDEEGGDSQGKATKNKGKNFTGECYEFSIEYEKWVEK